MSKLKIISILLFCAIIIALAIFCRSSFLAKVNKYELIGQYPHENGIAFVGKDVRYEGSKIGFVGQVAPTPEGSFLYFYIDRKISIPKDSGFHDASTRKRKIYINIRKGKHKESYQKGDVIKYIDVLKEIKEKRRRFEEARKPRIRMEWIKEVADQIITISESLENLHKDLEAVNKGLKPTLKEWNKRLRLWKKELQQ